MELLPLKIQLFCDMQLCDLLRYMLSLHFRCNLIDYVAGLNLKFLNSSDE